MNENIEGNPDTDDTSRPGVGDIDPQDLPDDADGDTDAVGDEVEDDEGEV